MNNLNIAAVDQAINSRRSIRAFLSDRIPQELIEEILAVASRAPSGSNTQPWKVYAVTGQTRQRIIDAVCQTQLDIQAHPDLAPNYVSSFDYYPKKWFSPFIERRRENGFGLYGLLGLSKDNKAGMAAQHLRNYQLFDAPVALFFTTHQELAVGAKMDVAMLMQNVMTAAQARGLATCPQAAWNHFHPIVLPLLGADANEELVCAIALGYADPNALVNEFITPRVPVQDFTVFLD
jgi:nitroreductase